MSNPADKAAKLAARDQKELLHWQKEKARKKPKLYLIYLIGILCLIYIVDEVSTSLHASLQTEINLDFFNGDTKGLSQLSLMETLANALLIIGFFYKTLADRYGRKPFLIFNTLGMVGGLLLCLFSPNLATYIVGFFVIRFFVTPDEQIVYIYETAPEKKRGTIHSIIKGVAELGLLLIPLGRKWLMGDQASQWRYVFLIPSIIGGVACFLALFFARETDPFIDSRIAYLQLTPEQREAIAKSKKDQSKKQGGFFAAIKYGWKVPQLRWIFLVTLFFTLSRTITGQYSAIFNSYFDASVDANTISAKFSNVTLMYPIGCAIVVFATGFISDKIGRKKTSVFLLTITLISLLLYVLGSSKHWNDYALGLCLGFFLGADWSNSDTLILMCGESAPTNLRASAMSAQTLFYGVGMVVSMLASTIVYKLIAKTWIGWYCLILALPCFALSLVFLLLKVKESKDFLLNAPAAPAIEAKADQTEAK
jgi:MFS family permease